MRSEANKRFSHGFNLTEQELRRIYDTIIQQMQKMTNKKPLDQVFEVKFKNGVIADFSNLDEILKLENMGSGTILRLKMKVEHTLENSTSSIILEFNDIDKDPSPSKYSISYVVVSDDRDWVFVTSSELDERIVRIKKIKPYRLFGAVAGMFIFMSIMTIIVIGALYILVSPGLKYRFEKEINELESIKPKWNESEYKDVVDVMIEIRKIEIENSNPEFTFNLSTPNSYIIVSIFLVFGLFTITYYSWNYFSPKYNFLWGDYLSIYEKRQSRGKIILFGVILAIVVGIIANYFSDIIGIGSE